MSGVYGNMMAIPKQGKGVALPTYKSGGTYVPGSGVTARYSDEAGRILANSARISANADIDNAKNLAKLGGDINKAIHVGINAYEDYSRLKATQLLLEYQKQVQDAMYGDGGIMLRQGEDAFTVDKDLEAKSKDLREKICKDYNGSLTENLFNMRAQAFDNTNMLRAQKYKADQYNAWAIREDTAAADTFGGMASASYANPEEYNKNAAQALWHTRQVLERKGYGPEAINKADREARRQMSLNAFKAAMAQEDYAGAERLLAGAGAGGSTSERNISANNYGNVKNTRGTYNAYATKKDGLMGVGERVLRYSNAPENGWHAETLLEMVNIYAPKGDGGNNPQEYAGFLGRRLGVGINDKINWRDPKVLAGLIQAMPAMEHGAKRGAVSSEEAMEAAKALLAGEKPKITGAAPTRGGYSGLTETDIASCRASLDAVKKRKEHEAKAEAQRQFEESKNATAASWMQELDGLPEEDQLAGLYERLKTVPAELRPELERSCLAQIKYKDREKKAQTAQAIAQFAEEVQKNNLFPLEAQDKLKDLNLSEEDREKAMNRAYGKIKETPENRAALDRLRIQIDSGEVKNKADIELFADQNRLTNDQIHKAATYLEKGGKMQGLSISRVVDAYKAIGGKAKDGKLPDGLYDTVVGLIPDGKAPNDKELQHAVATAIMDGKMKNDWFFGTKYYEAAKDGRLSEWRQDMTSEQISGGRQILQAMGLAKPSDDQVKDFYYYITRGGMTEKQALAEVLKGGK